MLLRRIRPARAAMFFALASVSLLAACGGDDPTATSTSSPTSEPSPVPSAEPSPDPTATATATTTATATATAVASPVATPGNTCEPRADSFPADCPRPHVEVNRDFEIPHATEDQQALVRLLSRIPDTPENRKSLMFRDVALQYSLAGWERLTYEDGPDAWLDRLMGDPPEGPVPQIPVSVEAPFLSGFGRYMTQMKTYESLGFDQRNVDQTAFAGTPPEFTGIVAGRYDPEFSAQLLAECDCKQLRVTEYGGYEYWSWDEEDYKGDLSLRLSAPVFDEVGRGGHVLITEDGLYRTLGEPLMHQLIDTLNGDMPSLADSEELRFILDVMGAHQANGIQILNDAAVPASSWMDKEGNEAKRANATLAPFLKPFGQLATGYGWDGSETFLLLVLVNEDEETAAENAVRLVDRVVNSNTGEGLPWGTEFSRIDVSATDRYTVARLYGNSPNLGTTGFLDLLLATE